MPDATISADAFEVNCGNRTVTLDYTVFIPIVLIPLPEGTPIAFYADGILVGQSSTVNTIPINGNESGTIDLMIPESVDANFSLTLVVDDDGFGIGVVTEINELNNEDVINIELLIVPEIIELGSALSCDEGFNSAEFNLIDLVLDQLEVEESQLEFYESITDLEDANNQILDPLAYNNISNPQTVYVRVENFLCYQPYAIEIMVEKLSANNTRRIFSGRRYN